MAQEVKYLIPVSGGLDSVYSLYHHLLRNRDDLTLLLHIQLGHKNHRRTQAEQMAVQRVMHWLRAHGIANFVYEETTFNYGTLDEITILDIEIVAMFAAIILKSKKYQHITDIILPLKKRNVELEMDRRYMFEEMLKRLKCRRTFTYHYPVWTHTRTHLVSGVPGELLQMAASCRTPIGGRPCGQCHTCREYIKEGLVPV